MPVQKDTVFCAPTVGMFGSIIDLGVDLEPLRERILECKLRYHRELWRIICDRGIQGGDGGGDTDYGDSRAGSVSGGGGTAAGGGGGAARGGGNGRSVKISSLSGSGGGGGGGRSVKMSGLSGSGGGGAEGVGGSGGRSVKMTSLAEGGGGGGGGSESVQMNGLDGAGGGGSALMNDLNAGGGGGSGAENVAMNDFDPNESFDTNDISDGGGGGGGVEAGKMSEYDGMTGASGMDEEGAREISIYDSYYDEEGEYDQNYQYYDELNRSNISEDELTSSSDSTEINFQDRRRGPEAATYVLPWASVLKPPEPTDAAIQFPSHRQFLQKQEKKQLLSKKLKQNKAPANIENAELHQNGRQNLQQSLLLQQYRKQMLQYKVAQQNFEQLQHNQILQKNMQKLQRNQLLQQKLQRTQQSQIIQQSLQRRQPSNLHQQKTLLKDYQRYLNAEKNPQQSQLGEQFQKSFQTVQQSQVNQINWQQQQQPLHSYANRSKMQRLHCHEHSQQRVHQHQQRSRTGPEPSDPRSLKVQTMPSWQQASPAPTASSNYSALTESSSGDFVPLICGDWTAAGCSAAVARRKRTKSIQQRAAGVSSAITTE